MSRMKVEVSKRNPYHIPKHKMLELKHFCLQYPDWKREYAYLNDFYVRSNYNADAVVVKKNGYADNTAEMAMKLQEYADKIKLVEETAVEADAELSNYILKAVTQEWSYDRLNARVGIPCCRDTFYDRWRKFFWLLSFKR